MKKVVRRIVVGFVIFVALLATLLLAALYSETVFRAAVNAAGPLIPGELSYASLDGTLAGPIQATNIDYTIAGTHVHADSLSFALTPSALLASRIRLSSLQAKGLVVTLPPPSPESGEPTRPSDIIEKLSLPVHLDIAEARIREARIENAAGEALLELERLDASLDWGERRLALTELDAKGPQGYVTGNATLGLKPRMRTDIDLDGQWQVGDTALAGDITASGRLAELSLDVALRQPAHAKLHATLNDLADSASWQGTLDVRRLALEAIRPTLPANEWSADLAFEGDWQDTKLNGTLRGGWPPATGMDLSVQGLVNAERLALDRVQGKIAAFDSRIDASAELHYDGKLRYSTKGAFTHFAWPQLAQYALRDGQFEITGDTEHLRGSVRASAGENPHGRLAVSGELGYEQLQFNANASGNDLAFAANGTRVEVLEIQAHAQGVPEDYRVQATAGVEPAGLPPARLKLDAEGNLSGLAANIERLAWLGGTAKGNVKLAWKDAFQLQTTLQAKNFSLEQLDPQLAGTLGGRLSATADFSGEQPRVSLQVHSLDGNYNGMAIDGSGSIRLTNGQVSTQGLKVTANEARLVLDDAADGGFDFQLDAHALERFHPQLAGEIHATGKLQGDLASPTVTIDANGSDLRWQDWRANALDLDATIRQGGRQASELHLQATDANTPVVNAGRLKLNATGSLAEHEIAVSVAQAGRDQAGSFTLSAGGGLQDGQWTGDIDTLRFDHPQTGEWALAQPGREKRITVGPENIDVPEHCLQGPQGSACIGPLSGKPGALEASGRLDTLPVSVIAGWLPPGLEYTGEINGHFSIEQAAAGPEGNLQLSLTPGGIRQVAGEGSENLLGWTSGEANIALNGNQATGELAIELADGGQVKGHGTLDMPADGPMSIDAQLNANVDNLQLLPSLVPELSRVQGRLTADLRVHGPVDNPRVQGRARLRDGSARVLALGGDWKNINLTLNAEGRQISGKGHIESGDGFVDLELSGQDTGEDFAGTANVKGRNFKAANTPEANVDVSPDLKLRLQGRDLYLDGSVVVPKARLEPRDLASATDVSEDQVLVNKEGEAGENGLRVHAAVTTRLGDDVHLEGFGLTAKLEGQVTVVKQPGNAPTANGKLFVTEGQYKAYGQDLTLAKGEIIYAGQPVRNPGLDIRAERHPNPDVMVGISVRGPLQNPTTSIYSDPVMSETAALGMLLFGRTVDDATGSQGQQISEASIALGLGGGKLLEKAGQRLGVEEVSVQDIGNRERASLVLGKYLSPDLYVSYGIGLFDAVNSFRLRYRISRRWMLEATSGLKSSADFIYTIER